MVLIALILVVNGVVGYMVFTNFAPKRRAPADDSPSLTAAPPKVGESIALIETLTESFDRAVLDSEEFLGLQKYGVWPVEGAATGRTNPFLPAFGP